MRLGVCIDGRGGTPAWRIEALGGTAVSLPLVSGYDPTVYLQAFRSHGWDAVLVIGPQAISDPSDWRGSVRGALERTHELLDRELVTHVALGYEPDDGWHAHLVSDDPLIVPRGGVGSWALSSADLAELVYAARSRLGRRARLLLGGLVSGDPRWLSRLDLSTVDGVLVHPYADVDLGVLLDGVRAEIAAQDLDGQVPIGIGELGRSDHDLRRGTIADWLASQLALAASRGDVSACFVCCDSDLTLDGYGQFDGDDRAKPSVSSIFQVSRLLPGPGDENTPGSALMGLPPVMSAEPIFAPRSGDPDLEAPEAPEIPETLPWPEVLGLSAQELAQALDPDNRLVDDEQELVESISSLWPQAGPHLELYGVGGDPAAAVALAATIWAQTDGRFRPVAEEGRYDRCERLYGAGTQTGLGLGNVRHGDGHRFRARGLVPVRGRAAYRQYGELLGFDLVRDPDLLMEPAIAMAVACAVFAANGLWAAAARGDYAFIRRVVDPGLNGYGPFVTTAQRLWSALDAREPAPEADTSRLAGVLARAEAQIGQPYRSGGAAPGGFDAGGLCAWAYLTAEGTSLPTDPDAIAGFTAPIGEELAVPGDLVLYAYGDPSRGGARFAHVALLSSSAGLVLDVRAGLGVGPRPHIRGAVRRYRRVPLAAVSSTERTDDGASQQEVAAEHLPGADPVPAPRRARRRGAVRAGDRGERGRDPGAGDEPAGGGAGGAGETHGEVVGELRGRRAGRPKPAR